MRPTLPQVMARIPQIVEGLRGPQHAPTAEKTFQIAPLPKVMPGHRIYRSRFRRYRMSLGKIPDGYDNATGKKIEGFTFQAVFDEYSLHIPGYFDNHYVPDELREEFIRRLDTSKRRGLDFDDVDTMKGEIKALEEQQARDILARNPGLRDKLVAELSESKGFKLPKKAAVAEEEETIPLPPPEAKKKGKKKTADEPEPEPADGDGNGEDEDF